MDQPLPGIAFNFKTEAGFQLVNRGTDIVRTTSLLRLAAAPGVLAFAAFATPVLAQEPAETACQDADNDGVCDPATSADGAASGSAIVVTGSRIRRPDEFSTTEPITVITAEEITQSGFNSATDALQSTAVTAGAGQINNFFGGFVTAGGTGANTLGLRNLGPARTLVLLNGRRIAPAGTRGNVLAADLNVLPTAIVERIEVLKAGASSIYGSDAVAGVVNIITDAQTRGLTIDAQVNVPEVGAGVDRRISATFGFDSDRLNLIGSVEYRKRDALRLNDRGFTKCPIGGFLSGEGTPFGSGDGIGFGGNPCFTLDNGGVTINTLGLPTRAGIGRTSGLPGNFNRFVPAPGQGGGHAWLPRRRLLRPRYLRSGEPGRRTDHAGGNLHRLPFRHLRAEQLGQLRDLRRSARHPPQVLEPAVSPALARLSARQPAASDRVPQRPVCQPDQHLERPADRGARVHRLRAHRRPAGSRLRPGRWWPAR